MRTLLAYRIIELANDAVSVLGTPSAVINTKNWTPLHGPLPKEDPSYDAKANMIAAMYLCAAALLS